MYIVYIHETFKELKIINFEGVKKLEISNLFVKAQGYIIEVFSCCISVVAIQTGKFEQRTIS